MMYKWLKDLFYFNRSLTGEGNRKTLSYFSKINPVFKILKFSSGLKVFDWKIPYEWSVKNAYIKNVKNGKVYANFKKNNLHLVGYSIPKNIKISFSQLKKKIYTEKKYPNAIPYVTSYYKKDWGFCLAHNELKKMNDGIYEVNIDSKFNKGNLEVAHALLRGKSKKEIMFSSYICHPSMANNELSGPVLLNYILRFLRLNFKNHYYSYRFVLGPETIGSIAYLSKYKDHLKKNLLAGYVLSCVGDDRRFSHTKSPSENNLADISLSASLIGKKNIHVYSFLDRGSDERQYCSPKINLPFTTFSRSKFGTYPEYHTSKDDLNLVSEKGLNGSFEVIKDIINSFEIGIIPYNTKYCEPHLSKYDLYPTISSKDNYKNNDVKEITDLLSYSDGKSNIFEISSKINLELNKLLKHLKILKKLKLLKTKYL